MGNQVWITNVLKDLAAAAEKGGLPEANKILIEAMVNIALVNEVEPTSIAQKSIVSH